MVKVEVERSTCGRWKANESARLAYFWHETTEPKGLVEGIPGS